jgi:signal transduction histidine kinase
VSDLGGHLAQEQSSLLEKVNALKENIHHINEIVALQQDYASVTGMLENVAPEELVENALLMHGESMKRHHIALIREFQPVPPVTIDRHKTLQILFNLLENAKHACLQTDHPQHEVIVSLQACEGKMFELSVTDNGMGISQENLARIFDQGFSTRKDGHGFGLHSSILMAQDMGGTMAVASNGQGKGASFTLRLPIKAPRSTAHAPPSAAAGMPQSE